MIELTPRWYPRTGPRRTTTMIAVVILSACGLWSRAAIAAPLRLAQATAPDAAGPAAPPAPPIVAPKPEEKAKVSLGTPATVIDGQQAESLLGRQAQSPTGEDMGHIVDVIVDKAGQIRAAVIDFGGFLGVGSRKIAVDWRSIHFPADGNMEKFVVDLKQDQLRVAPIYKEGEPVVVLGPAIGATTPGEPADKLALPKP